MIESAEEFIALRDSQDKEEYDRATYDEALLQVWMDIIINYPDYKKWVAHNKTTPLEILEELSKCSDVHVRYFVAMKRRLSSNIFERLSKDTESIVREQIAINRKTPLHILKCLCLDIDEDIAESASHNIKMRLK
jgi:hypothetical protein